MKTRSPETYTIMFLPSLTSAAYSFSISRKRAGLLGGLLLVLVLLLSGLVVHYVMLSRRALAFDALAHENREQRAQIGAVTATLEELNHEMARLRAFDAKLRIMTNLPTSAGVGGETPLAPAPAREKPGADQEGANRLERDLTRLRAEAVRQAESFLEVTRVVNARVDRWASTPSIWPVRGWITSGYGLRVSPFTDSLAMHSGIDITARMDTPFMAPAGGVVTSTGYDSALGRHIVIDHGYGIETVYGHLAKVLVVAGQRVSRRQAIGTVGSSGQSTGPHLHYEVRVNRTPVNPVEYILN